MQTEAATDAIMSHRMAVGRRRFFGQAGIGLAALASLLRDDLSASPAVSAASTGRPTDLPHFTPRARRVIYLFQSGGPSQIDLLDYKPELRARFGQEVPKSVYPDERKTTMSNAQSCVQGGSERLSRSRVSESPACV